MTNIGQGFEKCTGIFTAPVNGTYSFQATILTDNNREFWGNIEVNGISKAKINARGTDNRYGSGSQSLVITLREGDQAAVHNRNDGGMIYGNSYTSFGGYLLFTNEN